MSEGEAATSLVGSGRWTRAPAVALGLSLALFLVYNANGDVYWSYDATPSVYGAADLLEFGRLSFTPSRDPWLFEWSTAGNERPFRLWNLSGAVVDGVPAQDLRRAGALVANAPYYLARTVRVDKTTGEPVYVSLYGPAMSVFAVPFLAAARLFAAGDLRSDPTVLWYAAKVAASFMAAASAAFVFLTCRRWLATLPSVAIALAYGLGTCVWSTTSQTLWQHPANALLLSTGAYAFTRERESLLAAACAGLSLGLAVAARPTSAAFFAAAAAYLLLVDRRRLSAFLLAGVPPLAALAAFNLIYMGSPFRIGQTAVAPGGAGLWDTPLAAGLAGLLVSPSRGLFVFSPFLVLAIPGAILSWRRREYAALRPFTAGTAAVLLVQGKWIAWWGGHSYGYRIVSDLAVMLCIFMIPAWGWMAKRRSTAVAFLALLGWSVALQGAGAFLDQQTWNARPGRVVRLPSGDIVVREVEAIPAGPAPEQGVLVGQVLMDVNRPEFQYRLWSLRDSSLRFLWDEGFRGREVKRRQTRAWLEQFRPPEGAMLPDDPRPGVP